MMISRFLTKLMKPKIFSAVMTSFAQVIVVVLLLPFVAVILKLLMSEKIVEFITLTLGEIPLINVLTDFYMSFGEAENLKSFSLFEYIIKTITENMANMYIVGLFVYIFKRIGELIGIKGIAAIQTIVGIFFSCLCLKYVGDDLQKSIIAIAILMVISFILSVLLLKGAVLKFLADTSIGIGLSVITSGTICGYLTVLILILKGWYTTPLSIAIAIMCSLWPALLCLLIDFLLFGKKL